ncbi:MAG: hypothetical protein ABIK07_22845, partial [Planctomycetota bacterium]
MSNISLSSDAIPHLSKSEQNAADLRSNKVLETHSGLFATVRIWCSALSEWLGRYSVIAIIFAITVSYLLLLRTVMVVTYADFEKLSLWQGLSLFLVGLQFDVLVALCFVLPQLMHITFVSNSRVQGKTSRLLLDGAWIIAFMFLPFLCIAEFIFFDEFQSRLNYIAFEYIVYPTEVCCNIWQSYPLIELMATVGLSGGSLWFLFRKRFHSKIATPMPWKRRYGFL